MSDRPALIVDGYNVIFRLFPDAAGGGTAVAEARRDLERALTGLGARDGLDIWVDYDGAEVAGVLPEETAAESVRVRYTEPPAEADDAIVQRARQLLSAGQRPVVVITDDRELSRRVRAVGASAEGVDALALRLQRLREPRQVTLEAPEEEARLRAVHERQERIAAHAAEQDRRLRSTPDDDPPPPPPPQPSPQERRRLRGRRRQQRRLQSGPGKKRKRRKGRG